MLGDILPGSEVFLHRVSNFNFSVVMFEIRNNQPAGRAYVKTSGKFNFTCFDIGNYAFAVRTNSFNRSWGAPLPFEFDCENVSLKILFQGGDSAHMVGAFSINNSYVNASKDCRNNPWSCANKRGNLYVKCAAE